MAELTRLQAQIYEMRAAASLEQALHSDPTQILLSDIHFEHASLVNRKSLALEALQEGNIARFIQIHFFSAICLASESLGAYYICF
jgi:hypothetical protein